MAMLLLIHPETGDARSLEPGQGREAHDLILKGYNPTGPTGIAKGQTIRDRAAITNMELERLIAAGVADRPPPPQAVPIGRIPPEVLALERVMEASRGCSAEDARRLTRETAGRMQYIATRMRQEGVGLDCRQGDADYRAIARLGDELWHEGREDSDEG